MVSYTCGVDDTICVPSATANSILTRAFLFFSFLVRAVAQIILEGTRMEFENAVARLFSPSSGIRKEEKCAPFSWAEYDILKGLRSGRRVLPVLYVCRFYKPIQFLRDTSNLEEASPNS